MNISLRSSFDEKIISIAKLVSKLEIKGLLCVIDHEFIIDLDVFISSLLLLK